jgi:hypothetical protein
MVLLRHARHPLLVCFRIEPGGLSPFESKRSGVDRMDGCGVTMLGKTTLSHGYAGRSDVGARTTEQDSR